MKIAILTQPLGHNYGGILQAYALQKVLRDLGHDVTTIDRRVGLRPIARLTPPLKRILYPFLGRPVAKKLSSEQRKLVYAGLTGFMDNHIKRSETILRDAELKSHFKDRQYDLTIVGSDQVWRPKYSPNIYNYFGDFLGRRQAIISYAASFGVDEWEFDEDQTLKCRELVAKFNAVSVRESSAINLCKNNLGINAELVLDPTMLISAEDYRSKFGQAPSRERGGVLKYLLDASDRKVRVVKQLARRLNIETLSAQPAKTLFATSASLSDYKYPPVEEWVMSFNDADYVVTDSFHGCVFSIIFNKPFIAIGNRERGLSRFESLLGMFGLGGRLINERDDDEAVLTILGEKIDWASVNSEVAARKDASMAFLGKWV